MSVMGEIEELKNHLLKTFAEKVESKDGITQIGLEKAIEDHQGCSFPIAKYLINLLWEHHSMDLTPIYKLVDPDSGLSIEIKDTIREAHKY